MTETQLQAKISKYLSKRGYYVIRLRSVHPDGIPDLLAVKPNDTLFIEVKRPGGIVAKLQQQRVFELNKYGARAYIIDSLEKLKKLC